MADTAFAYPKLYYFLSGNEYTGSYKGMNYKLKITTCEKDGEETKVLWLSVWYGPYCSALSEPVAEFTFPVTEEGLDQSRDCLREQYAAFLKKA